MTARVPVPANAEELERERQRIHGAATAPSTKYGYNLCLARMFMWVKDPYPESFSPDFIERVLFDLKEWDNLNKDYLRRYLEGDPSTHPSLSTLICSR